MSSDISISVGGDVDLKKVNAINTPISDDLFSFLKNKTNLNFIFLNCPYTTREEVYSKCKDYVDGFDFNDLDYIEGSFESISISSLCEQQENNTTAFNNIFSGFKSPFVLREGNCYNFLKMFSLLPSPLRDKTIVYFFYKNPHDISKEMYCDEKTASLQDISQIIDDFDGYIVRQSV